jgi:hypothetical protein
VCEKEERTFDIKTSGELGESGGRRRDRGNNEGGEELLAMVTGCESLSKPVEI